MPDLQLIDISLGLIFVYLVLSIICTAANELVCGMFKLRSKNLTKAVENLLKDKGIEGLEKSFYNHPLIKSLYKGNAKPSYIPPRTFALAIVDLIPTVKAAGSNTMKDIQARVNELPDGSDIKKTLLVLMDEAGDDLEGLRSNVEQWVDNAMSRASGWYKRKTQLVVLALAFVVTVGSNADTFHIVKSLSNDPALRNALVAQIEVISKQEPLQAPEASHSSSNDEIARPKIISDNVILQTKKIQDKITQIDRLGVPLGWYKKPHGFEWYNKIFGLLITVMAVSLGAPFWFDILQRVSRIRSTGRSPDEEQKAKKS